MAWAGSAGRGSSLPVSVRSWTPIALSVMALLLAVPVLFVSLAAARRRPRRRVELAWGGGGVRVSPRMQYTATSYAEPLARVFDDALRPERDIEVTHTSESRYLVERVEFRQRLGDVVEERAYRPMLRLADRVGLAARRPPERQHPPLPGLLVPRPCRGPGVGGPVNAEAGVLAAAQVVAMVALSPLLVGMMRQVRARLEGRVGRGGARSRGATCASCSPRSRFRQRGLAGCRWPGRRC